MFNQKGSVKATLLKIVIIMAAEWIGPAISGTAALLGTGASAIATGNLNKKNRAWQEQQAKEQREWSEGMWNAQNAWNEEMWNKENAYNSPEQQVERLREAGLNPLNYGLDGNSTSGPEAAQALGYERASTPTYANPFEGFEDIAMKVAQIANIQADTAKKNNENLTETQRREKLIAEIDVTKQDLKNKLAEEGLTEAKRKEIEKGLEWADRLNEAILAEKEAKAKLDNAQQKRIEELLEGEKLIQSKTIEDFDHKWNKIRAEIAKMAKETGLLEKDIENYALNHANNGFMGSGLSIQNLLRLLLSGDKKPKERDIPEDVQDIINSGQ